jgi:hypothetical protein
MAGVAGSGNRACGHPAHPGTRFCPVCGEPATGGAVSQPSTAPLPVVPAWPQSAWPPPAAPAAAPPPQPEPAPWDSWYAPRRPPPPPPGPQAWPAPPGGVQPPPAGPDPTRVDGLVPSGDPPTAMLGDLRLAPASEGPRRPPRPLVAVIVAAALVAVVAGVIFRALSGSTAAGGTAGATPSASSQDTRRQVAAGLSGLLAQSVTDRAAVIAAAEDVRGCGPSLRQDARTFTRAASNRQRLLSLLASLPSRPLLPAAMLQDLTSAWQASAQVDTDLAGWTQDNIARGCHGHSRSDASLRASDSPEDQATAGKRAFVTLWNPIARQYGLTTYQRSQL